MKQCNIFGEAISTEDGDNPSEDIDMHEDNKDYLFSFHREVPLLFLI